MPEITLKEMKPRAKRARLGDFDVPARGGHLLGLTTELQQAILVRCNGPSLGRLEQARASGHILASCTTIPLLISAFVLLRRRAMPLPLRDQR